VKITIGKLIDVIADFSTGEFIDGKNFESRLLITLSTKNNFTMLKVYKEITRLNKSNKIFTKLRCNDTQDNTHQKF